ncbi:type II toxin-antitoxin system VapC family toxin [Treponema pectinovorum]|uniref:type II toxin-antitoxin system VapC family toxin n=1 Tax=Treponema pectinovorum TaxID=164 RepID=UPI0011F2A958|nr:type II toxin-antitoxin system VapC family toxin [Treponema pectinovorum]
MKILLDTHIILWTLTDSEKLSKKARQIILNPNNHIFYSVVSMWEISIKHSKNPEKLNISGSMFMHYCEQSGFCKLPLDDRHITTLETLEQNPNHNDPFDRILLSQAKADSMLFLTHDHKFSFYDEPYVAIV